LEQESADLRTCRFQLETRLAAEQQSATALREQAGSLQQQLLESTAALGQAHVELEQQKGKFDVASADAEHTQRALQEKEARCGQLEKSVADLQTVRSELQLKLDAEREVSTRYGHDFEARETALRDNADALEKTGAELQQRLTQLQVATTAARQAEQALQQRQARCQELEREVAALQAGRDELQARLAAIEKAAADVQDDYEALRKEAHDNASLLASTQADLHRQSANLDAASAVVETGRKALREKEDRCSQMEKDIAALETVRSELRLKLTAEQEVSARYRHNLDAVETALRDNADALEEARDELQQQSARLQSATAAAGKAEQALQQHQARCQELERQVATLQAERDEVQAKLAAEQESAARSRRDCAELRQQLGESMAVLLLQQKAEWERREAEHRNPAAANQARNCELTRVREQSGSRKRHPARDPAPDAPGQNFRLDAPDASNVLLVGDFTAWRKEPIQMKQGPDGVWSVTVDLQPGTYRYLFVVDGRWTEDPACTQRVANEFGGQNMVRQVL
jgi:chromosome segregation ATPase